MNLRQEYVQKVNKANSILADMIKDGYGDLSVIQRSLKQYNKIVPSDDKFETAKRLNNRQKISAIKSLDKFINSKWVSKEGRQSILDKRINTFMSDEKYNMTKRQTLKLFDVFSSTQYHQLQEKYALSSSQLIDLIKTNKKATANDVIKSMQQLIDKDKIERGTVRSNLEDLVNDKISKRYYTTT